MLILKEETLKVFKLYFLALLLIFALPVFGQEAPAPEGTPAQGDTAAPAQEAPAETAQQNEAAAAEQPAEAAPAEEAAPAKEEAEPAKEEAPKEEAEPAKEEAPKKEEAEPAKEEAPKEEAPKEEAPAAEEGQSDLEAELAAQAEGADAETAAGDKAAENEKQPTFTIGINNGLSHGFAKERKTFAYTLNVFAAYNFPLEFTASLNVGLREAYRYGMSEAVATEAGVESSSDLNYSKFDGTPFTLGLSKGFPIAGGVVGSIGVSAAIPFTSKEMWDVYDIRTILGVDLSLAKNFQLPKEVTLGLSFGFSYAKTFADNDAAWDPYSNEPLGYLQNHDIGLVLGLGIGYKGFGFKLSGGYSFGSDFKLSTSKYYYDDWDKGGTIDDSSWYYLFSFGATASYAYKGFVFALGVRTNAPEFDNGNYEGFTERPGDPEVKDGATNYPFKAKYTTVFANIGYSYSF